MNPSKTELAPLQDNEWRKRLRLVTDVVFASAMTLMIFNIEIPNMGDIEDPVQLGTFLVKQLSNMGVFFITFVVIAIYWVKHLEHYSFITRVDQKFVWLQLFFLLCIMLLPFWNTYASLFAENLAIKIFLSLNMILVGLFSYFSLQYASRPANRMIHPGVGENVLKTAKTEILSEPLIAALAAGLAFINVELWDIAFILIPVVHFGYKKITNRKSSS